MSSPVVSLRVVAAVLCVAAVAAADPATQSSLPWLIQGVGPVARAGRTLFFADTYAAVPRANAAQGIAVFSQSEAVGESVDLVAGSDVLTVIPDGAGGWYAGGMFSSVGALPRRGVAHILANGNVDPTFVADLSSSGAAFSMALNGSQLIIAGFFSTVNLVPRNGLAWVNAATGQVLAVTPPVTGKRILLSGSTLLVAEGSVWALNATTGVAIPGFVPAPLNPGGRVDALATEGTSLFIGGGFSTVNGAARGGLAKLDAATGFLDPVWKPTASGNVSALAAASGTLYVGGFFDTIGGQPRANLAALSTAAAGTATAWRADANQTVNGLAVQAGALYIAGNFSTLGGVPRQGGAAVSVSTPAAVLPWDPGVIGLPRGIAAGSGKVALVGSLNGWGARTRPGLAAIDVVTGQLLPWAPNVFGVPNEMITDGTRLILGGQFSQVDGASRFNVAAFDLETRALLPFAPVVTGTVSAMAAVNGVLYIGGSFTQVDGAFRLNLAAIDLQSGQLLPWDPQADGAVYDITAQGGSVIVGGAFTSLIGTNGFRTRIGVGEITSAGAVTAFDANLSSGAVFALAQSGPTLYVGGTFPMIGGVSRPYAAAVVAASGALLPWNPVLNAAAEGFSINRGFVYMRGSFSTVGGAARSRLARVTVTDAALSSWQLPFTSTGVRGLAAFDDGVLVSASASSTTPFYRDDGKFLPEQALAGVPGPPAETAARVVGSTLSLTFGPPVVGPRPTSYLLEAGTGPSLSNLGTLPLSTTTFAVAGVPPGLYYVRVRAVGGGGVGAASNELAIAVGAATCTAAPTAPPAPTTTVAGASVLVDWRASPGSPPSAFTLLAGTSAGFANLGVLPLGTGTSFAAGGVPAGVYFVRVFAANACGQSAPSADGVLRVGGAAGPPGAPLQISGTAVGGAVAVSWLTSTGGAPTSHLLEAGTGPTLSNLGVVALGPGTALATAGVPAGTYYVRVRAMNAAGISPPSGELILVVP